MSKLASEPQASAPVVRAGETAAEDAPEHRRRTARQVRHTARARLHVLAGDEEALEDADLVCPHVPHDLGRKASSKPKRGPKPGRRPGFKVWKTPFWKRRRALWAAQNDAARRLAKEG
ncbi:MAG TPA: hypothetical protein VGL49_06285 [Acidimicrobiales bacterium]